MLVSNALESQDFHFIFYLSSGNVIKTNECLETFQAWKRKYNRKYCIMYTPLHKIYINTYTHACTYEDDRRSRPLVRGELTYRCLFYRLRSFKERSAREFF
jgi:hypothetical protein